MDNMDNSNQQNNDLNNAYASYRREKNKNISEESGRVCAPFRRHRQQKRTGQGKRSHAGRFQASQKDSKKNGTRVPAGGSLKVYSG